jgi:uncharacterized protein (UPF0332 family)
MTFEWKDYFILACDLKKQAVGSSIEEALLRSAISRAYYAAFCIARNYLRDVIKDPDLPYDGTAHSFMIGKFRNSNNRNYLKVGNNLDRLRAYRRFADYDDIVSKLNSRAADALYFAEQVISLLKS